MLRLGALITAIMLLLSGCDSAPVKQEPIGSLQVVPLEKIAFEHDTWDFGTIHFGEIVKHTFRFTNASTLPLKIEGVKPSCSCTAPSFTKDVIKPGEKGFVSLEYDSNKGEQGVVQKYAIVQMNTKPTTKTLIIKMEVIK